MIELRLNNGMVAVVDDEYAHLAKWRWQAQVMKGGKVYAWRHFWQDNRSVKTYLHRLVAGAIKGQHVDHIDGNTLNDRRENLRTCTNQQNSWNQRKREGSSRYKGVSWFKANKRWRAHLATNGKQHHLGYFGDELSAAKAYDAAARKHFGEFAKTNFPA